MGRPLEEKFVCDIRRIDRRILHLEAFGLGGICNIGSHWIFVFGKRDGDTQTDQIGSIILIHPSCPSAS